MLFIVNSLFFSPLPPRTRGRRHGRAGLVVEGPSTPAHAGPTAARAAATGFVCLYPRARGADA